MSAKKEMIFSCLVILLCFILGSSILAHGEEKTYAFKAPDYRIMTSSDGFQRISMDGYFSYGVSGYPDLPSKIFHIGLPPDVEITSIIVSYSASKVIDLGKFHIKELPRLATRDGGEETFGGKADIYSNDMYYPERVIEYTGFSQMRKWRMANVKYTPFQYNPVTGDLKSIPEVVIRVNYDVIANGSASVQNLSLSYELSDNVMDSRASQMLLNFSESRPWYPSSDLMRSSATYDYVIITTNTIKNSSTKLNDFKSYLVAKGHSPLVVTESDFDSLTGQSPNERQDKIRKWLQNNYIGYGIKYVLLIGDPDPYDGDIPMKRCWPRKYYYTDRESPTDYYYADLTGNWDRNGDGYYGYAGSGYPEDDGGPGGVDFMNEVYVGRIPVYSRSPYGVPDDPQWVSHLDSVLTKIINYGTSTNTAWRKSALMPMSFSDEDTDGAYLSEAMISNYLSPAGISSYKMYMQGNLCGAGANSVFPSNEELVDGATKTRWSNNTYGLVWWWGHGVDEYAELGYSGCGSGVILSSYDTSSLNNSYPAFVYQNSCLNGRPETPTNLGTALLYNGAIATVSASRVSWYRVGAWNTSFKYGGDNASIGYYYGLELVKNGKSAGEALYNVKSDMGTNGSYWSGDAMMSAWMNLFDFNLYGDPAAVFLPDYKNPLNDTTEFVKQQYRDFLNREADAGGLAYWVNRIDGGAMTREQVIDSFFWSNEFGYTIAPIVRLYFAYFLRIPDYGGLQYWINQYKNGTPLASISDQFAASNEFIQRYGSLTHEQFVTLVYQNVLGRSPDPGGYAYWVGQLNSGTLNRGQVMLGFSESDEYKEAMNNEVFVTMMYIGMLRRAPEQGGFDYWVGYLDRGNSELTIIYGFLISNEYASRFQ